MNEKVMPQKIDAEQSVLGAMFLSKTALEKAVESLNKDMFYLDAHKKIFEVMKNLDDKKVPIDITTVTNELEEKKLLNQIGGVAYLTEIVNVVPTAANVDQYIKIIEDKYLRRNLIEAGTEITDLGFSSPDDIGEVLDEAEKKIFDVVKNRRGSEFKTIQDVLFKAQADLEKLSSMKNEITGVPTGYYDIDKLTSGFHDNELIIIAARPAMGKTAFALNMAVNMAVNAKKSVALFNMEMGAEQLITRMLASVGQIESSKLRTGRLEHQDWKRVNEAIRHQE